jgi:prefoldin beta subunit
MEINKKLQDKIQELQLAEQNLQNFLLQKQTFQLELNETNSAIEEAKKSKGEIYKIVGQIMIKTSEEEVTKESQEKKSILDLRLKSIEKQENILKEKMEKLRKEIEDSLRRKKQN